MLLQVHTERKFVEVWLTKKEARDENVKRKLKEIFAEFKSKKYLVVVYEGGEDDLFEATRALLLRQRELYVQDISKGA